MIKLKLLFSFLFILFSPCANAESLSGSRPNIILIITDDQGYGPVGAHGHPWIETPNLDKLYSQSTRFERFLVSPTCSPTRAAIMSGRHPLKNGVTHTILERERMALSTYTIAQGLSSVNYQTGIFGKWHLGDEKFYQPENRGFNEVFIHGAGGIGQAYACSCADAPGNKYFDPVIRHNGKFVKTKGYCTNIFFNAALGWIKEVKKSSKPFFAYITTNAPHGPFIAPPSNTNKLKDLGFGGTQAGFYGMIENIDENVGLLTNKLSEWGLDNNTLLIFMSDNGMTGGGSGRPGKEVAKGYPFFNAGQKGLKGGVDEGSVRVPFFVRWLGKIKEGSDVKRIAAHIDIFPTFADLAGLKLDTKLSKQVEGRSLLKLIADPEADWEDRFLFTQKARWKTGSEPSDHMWKNFSVRNQRYRLVGQNLFDMISDPSQKFDISKANPEVVNMMRKAYEEFWNKARPLMVNEKVPMSKVRPYHVWYKEQLAGKGIPAWNSPKL